MKRYTLQCSRKNIAWYLLLKVDLENGYVQNAGSPTRVVLCESQLLEHVIYLLKILPYIPSAES